MDLNFYYINDSKEISRYWPWNVHFLSLSIHHRRPRVKASCTTYSFPSGHSFGSFAAATALYLGLSNICPTKRFWGVIALIGACVVAFARVYLFVHYPTDVLTGLVLGIIVGCIAWKIAKALWSWWTGRKNEVEYEPYTFKRKN